MRRAIVVMVIWGAVVLVSVPGAWGRSRSSQPTPIARGPRISGVVRYQPQHSSSSSTAPVVSCIMPGGTNYRTDCASTGRPVNETSITYGGALGSLSYYAGANDYNSYNGQGQDGFYWSSTGTTWNDAGPIDVFPHNTNNGAGDPGLAVDGSGVVYYSSLFFNFHNCNVGGVELLRRNPSTGAWSYYQIASNSKNQFQDKPAITLSGSVYESWTQFGSCSGSNVTSPIKVAVLPTGASSASPSKILSVPGSKYSQGSSIAPDGTGGIWIAWEEWPSATATIGSIKLAHYTGSSWVAVSTNGALSETISPSAFTDLPSPLPGFKFRTNSFPALTTVSGNPEVVWTSYDTGVGRAYLWAGGSVTMLDSSGSDGDQFFPSIAPNGSGGVDVAYSQVNSGPGTYDQWLYGGTFTKVSTSSSNPNQDAFFSGQFIGDYNAMTAPGGIAHPIWTDIRGPDPSYPGWEMDSMFYAP